jgi:hypothetical protein
LVILNKLEEALHWCNCREGRLKQIKYRPNQVQYIIENAEKILKLEKVLMVPIEGTRMK